MCPLRRAPERRPAVLRCRGQRRDKQCKRGLATGFKLCQGNGFKIKRRASAGRASEEGGEGRGACSCLWNMSRRFSHGMGEKQAAAMTGWLMPHDTLTQAANAGPAKKQGPAQAPIKAMHATGPASVVCVLLRSMTTRAMTSPVHLSGSMFLGCCLHIHTPQTDSSQ